MTTLVEVKNEGPGSIIVITNNRVAAHLNPGMKTGEYVHSGQSLQVFEESPLVKLQPEDEPVKLDDQ